MRNLYLRISVVAAIFAIASCSETAVQPEKVTDSEVTLSINATFDNTKTYIEHDGSAYHANWHKGDVLAIAIDNDYGSRKSFKNASEDGESADFTGSVTVTEGNHTLSGYYPKDISVNRKAETAEFEITIPSVQTMPSLTSFDKSADILIGKPTTVNIDGTKLTSVNMPFRRAGSILKIIPVDNTGESLLNGLKISSISIESASDIITGRSLKCCIDNSADDELVSGKGSTSITVNYAGEDFNINGTNAAYAIVAPNKFSSGVQLTIDITTNDDNVTIHKVVTPSSDINLTAGMVKPLQIKINDADVTVNTEPTLTILKTEVKNIPYSAATDLTITEAYNLLNCTDADVDITCDGTVITSATFSSGTITYNISENDGVANRNGTIGMKLKTEGEYKNITVTQLYNGGGAVGTTYTWGFTSAASITDNTEYNWVSKTGEQTIVYPKPSSDSITEFPSKSEKYCLKMNGDSGTNGSRRYFTYTAPAAGTLTIRGYQNGSNDATLTVLLGETSITAIDTNTGFTSTSGDPTECKYYITGAGTVKFYSAKKSYFHSVEFSY